MDRNAVTNGDGILANQNVFNQESHDFLAFNDTKRFRRAAQASKECCESLCQAQECDAIISLVGNRLQLSTECLLAMTQCRHTITQLLKRQESFLIGGEKSFDTFADMGNSLCRLCSRFAVGSEVRAASSRRSSSWCIKAG